MRDVAIIGAGELGGLLAHALARRDAAARIRLIDEAGQIAAGKALDITQAAPIERFATQLSGATDTSMAAGAAVVVIADRADRAAGADRIAGGEWNGEDGLMLLRRLAEIASSAVILCAGSSQRGLIERGVRELRLARSRLFGSAPEALAAGARALVALETNGSPRDVVLSLVGVPPDRIVTAWEDATVGGFAATRLLDEPVRRRINARLPALWPPGPYALATAAAAVIEAVIGRSRRLATCFVAPDDSTGIRMRAAALPVRLGPSGIVKVVPPALSVRDRVALDNAMML
jgi:malate dehydrogenase